MWCCRHVDDLKQDDALIVRIHGDKVTGLGCRDTDLFGMQLAHRLGCFPPVYACFNNGCVYKFAKDRNVTFNDLMDPDVIQNLTRNLHRIHAASGHQTGLTNWRGEEVTFDFKPKSVVEFIRDAVHMIPEYVDPIKRQRFVGYRKEYTNEVLLNECVFLQHILDDLELNHVLSHNDIYHENLILNKDNKEITIIDYELMGMNYEYADLAFLLTAWRIFVPAGYAGPDNPELPHGMRELYVKSYLHAKYESNHDKTVEVPEEDVEVASIAVEILEATVSLRSVALCLCFINTMDVDAIFSVATKVYADSKSKIQRLRHDYAKIKEKSKIRWIAYPMDDYVRVLHIYKKHFTVF